MPPVPSGLREEPMSVSVRQLCASGGAHENVSHEESANDGADPLICPGVQKLQTFRIIGRPLELLATAFENWAYSVRGSLGHTSNHCWPAPQKSNLTASKPHAANWLASVW